MIILLLTVPCVLRSRDNNAGPSVAVPRVSVGLASKLEPFLNFQSIFCGTIIDYRSFSVKESVLFYWCKALCVPRHPAMLRGACNHHKHNHHKHSHHKHNHHHHQNHHRSHNDLCNQSNFCFCHL